MKQQYLIRAGALAGYSQLVESVGGEANVLLADCQLTMQDLNNEDTMIPFNVMVQLLEHTSSRLNCPDFGLRLGLSQDADALGSLGLFMLHCKTVREVLISIQRFIAVHSQAEYWQLQESGELAFIERFGVSQELSHARQFKELSFGVCLKLMKTLIKGSVFIERLEFAHSPISDISAYKKLFACDVCFNQEHDRLVVKRHYLDYKLLGLNSDNKQLLEHALVQKLAQYPYDLERQITMIILQTLGTTHVNLDYVAALLNINKRTLQRRLKAQQLSFKTILNDVRMKTAYWHLEASSVDITLLSEILGYTDISAFSKAFKAESGLSPLQWRQSKKQTPVND